MSPPAERLTQGPDGSRAPKPDLSPQVPTLIGRKRDGGELTGGELRGLVQGYLAGEVDDAQMAALLMAGVIRGFSRSEAVAFTEILVASGARIELDWGAAPTVDKHSTGGVGDTTTLVVGPLLAAAGCQVVKLAGRGLGHTGGTIDKLESIPGMRTDLGTEELRTQVEEVGIVVAAANHDLAPADKRLYALRDVTATVNSPALIASSIMSKKLAAGAEHVLLDVKVGDGGFFPDLASARELAALCVAIGASQGRRTAAVVTDMSQPLSEAVGNALEVTAAVETLQGRGGRLRDLSLSLAAAGLELTGEDPERAEQRVRQLLDGGAALDAFRRLIVAQGGDARVADDPRSVLAAAPTVVEWHPDPGCVTRIGCRRLGELAGGLGAGRRRQGEVIDPSVGIELLVRVGDEVDGDMLGARVHARTRDAAQAVAAELSAVVTIGPEPAPSPELVLERVGFDR